MDVLVRIKRIACMAELMESANGSVFSHTIMLHFWVRLHVGQNFQEWTKEILWKAAFKKFEGFKIFKGCLPQILLGPPLNTLSSVIQLAKIIANF